MLYSVFLENFSSQPGRGGTFFLITPYIWHHLSRLRLRNRYPYSWVQNNRLLKHFFTDFLEKVSPHLILDPPLINFQVILHSFFLIFLVSEFVRNICDECAKNALLVFCSTVFLRYILLSSFDFSCV